MAWFSTNKSFLFITSFYDQIIIFIHLFYYRTVTSELIFYIEMLKKLNIFPAEDLTENSLEDIWL